MRPLRGVGTMVVLVKPTTIEMGRPYGMSVFAILVWLAMLVLSSSSASALPVASGSKCTADWVNNAGAMACFIQGEEDLRNGASHPHYVACTSAGEVFCCVDNARGQDCEAVKVGGRPPNETVKLGAILDAQQTTLTLLGQISTKIDKLESELEELKRKSSP
jgi:hypothetical protein